MPYVSKHFKDSEFFCRDGCGLGRESVDDSTVELLDKIRDEWGSEVRVVSSCRCRKHNAAVSTCKNPDNSLHMAIAGRRRSLACDITILDLSKFKFFRRLCDKLNPNGGVGFYKHFIHVDTRGHTARWRG